MPLRAARSTAKTLVRAQSLAPRRRFGDRSAHDAIDEKMDACSGKSNKLVDAGERTAVDSTGSMRPATNVSDVAFEAMARPTCAGVARRTELPTQER